MIQKTTRALFLSALLLTAPIYPSEIVESSQQDQVPELKKEEAQPSPLLLEIIKACKEKKEAEKNILRLDSNQLYEQGKLLDSEEDFHNVEREYNQIKNRYEQAKRECEENKKYLEIIREKGQKAIKENNDLIKKRESFINTYMEKLDENEIYILRYYDNIMAEKESILKYRNLGNLVDHWEGWFSHMPIKTSEDDMKDLFSKVIALAWPTQSNGGIILK